MWHLRIFLSLCTCLPRRQHCQWRACLRCIVCQIKTNDGDRMLYIHSCCTCCSIYWYYTFQYLSKNIIPYMYTLHNSDYEWDHCDGWDKPCIILSALALPSYQWIFKHQANSMRGEENQTVSCNTSFTVVWPIPSSCLFWWVHRNLEYGHKNISVTGILRISQLRERQQPDQKSISIYSH